MEFYEKIHSDSASFLASPILTASFVLSPALSSTASRREQWRSPVGWAACQSRLGLNLLEMLTFFGLKTYSVGASCSYSCVFWLWPQLRASPWALPHGFFLPAVVQFWFLPMKLSAAVLWEQSIHPFRMALNKTIEFSMGFAKNNRWFPASLPVGSPQEFLAWSWC